jgi:hypothetical protein
MSASKVVASSARLALLARMWADLVGIRPTRRHHKEARVSTAEPGFGDTAFGQYRLESRLESTKTALPAQRDPPPPP